MQRDKQVYTLAQLKKEHDKDIQSGQPDKLHSTIGLIVDASNVYRYETSRDFTQKLKIVDSTNSADPLQVYLWSNRKEDFTLNLKVGDIILLNNFKIDSYNERLQAKKAYKTEDSYFRIFSGSPDTSNYHPIDKKVGLDDEDGKVLTALNQLRTFAKTHFTKNRVPVMFKPDAKAKVDPKKPTSSDFDVILRVIDAVEMSNHYKIRLTNEKDEFHLNYTRQIEAGVYKVRSVADVKWEDRICNLSGNDYTFFLEISSWMLSHDPKEWERIVSTPETIKKKSKRAKIETKIVGSSKKIKSKTLKELFSQDEHKDEVRVTCEVMDIITTFDDAFKKYDKDNNTEKSKESETGEYIYSIHMLLSDDSLEGEVCNAYVYTFDGKGLEFLPELHPNGVFGRNTLDLKENYDNFVNRVVEESDFKDTPIELILSPLFNGKETIYRIVDTQMLF